MGSKAQIRDAANPGRRKNIWGGCRKWLKQFTQEQKDYVELFHIIAEAFGIDRASYKVELVDGEYEINVLDN